MPDVLHIIRGLSRGGAASAMLGLARRGMDAGSRQAVLSLVPADPDFAARTRASGVEVHEGGERIGELADGFDIVLVHWWNSPEMDAFLRRPLPPMRLALWLHVGGRHAPQVVTRRLMDIPDTVIGCSPETFVAMSGCGSLGRVCHVLAGAEFAPLEAAVPGRGSGFVVGYVGTVDFHKMHPDYAAMNAAVRVEDARFVVCGDGDLDALNERIRATGREKNFDVRGYVENVAPVFAEMDVFGYPLCDDTYAAAELSLQEAMFCGVPPVVFPHGGVRHLVEHGKTGLVVHSPEEYAGALEHLHANPAVRMRLADNARRKAVEDFGADNTFARMNEVFEDMLSRPRAFRSAPAAPSPECESEYTVKEGPFAGIPTRPVYRSRSREASELTGAERFVESLGGHGKNFTDSMSAGGGNGGAVFEADRQIAAASPLLASRWSGGVLHWAACWPEDPWLCFWSGLVQIRTRPERAEAALHRAADLGLPEARVGMWLEILRQETDRKE